MKGGFGTFSCMLNSLVHFVMYFYYFLSSFGDTFRKYLWWKKYLTAFQMVIIRFRLLKKIILLTLLGYKLALSKIYI